MSVFQAHYDKHFQDMIGKEMERFYMALDNGAREEIRKIVREELAAQSKPAEATEPEYGWSDFANELGKSGVFWDISNEDRLDLLRGTCVRLMREAGWYATRVDDSLNGQWFWCYHNSIGEREYQEASFAESEPAAYRDMLKHAGVLK